MKPFMSGIVVLEIGNLTRTVSTARWADDAAITRTKGLEVRAGQVTALTGPPLAGTSEILRTVFQAHIGGTGRILYRTRDGIRINLTELDDEERLVLQEKEFGFVGGVRRLPADLSIVGHVARDLVASQSLTAAEARHKAQHALEDFEIESELLHQPGRTLPEELQTRVELVRALAKAPRLLLLDEPVKLLPPSLHRILVDRLRELGAAGTATLMACRSLWLLEEIADEVLELPSRGSAGEVA
jgi:ABC-type polar amino acid transport system ATPase subunit